MFLSFQRKYMIYCVYVLFITIFVVIDQFSKKLIVSNFKLNEVVPVIKGFFNLTYVRNFIPQTETLLASYDDMTVQERNELLKTILYKIEYYRGEDGIVSIDLYPRLPKV